MFEWNKGCLCFITVITGFLINFTRGLYSKKKPDNLLNLWRFNFFQSIWALVMVIIIFAFSNMIGCASWFSVTIGAMMGIANVLSLYASLRAYAIGPFSYTSVIISLSAIIPTLSGLFYDERISLFQYIGIFMMIICIVLSPDEKIDDNKT